MNDAEARIRAMFQALNGPPRLFLHQIDWAKGNCLLIEADEDFYRDAAFLDDRVLATRTSGGWFALKDVAARVASAAGGMPACHFIFHIGHCGSTLISRMLGYCQGVLSLREPTTLRNLAEREMLLPAPDSPLSEADFTASLEMAYRLLARRFEGQDHVVVKATSFCSSLGPRLIGLNPGNRALLLGTAPEIYVAAMLGAKDYVADVRRMAGHRAAALSAVVGDNNIRPAGLSDAELVALSWATEILNLARIADAAGPERAQYMDFDAFLGERDASCLNICAHFGLAPGEDFLQRLASSGMFGQYSKAAEFAFGVEERRRRLDESRHANAAALAEALGYLQRLTADLAPLAGAARRFGYTI